MDWDRFSSDDPLGTCSFALSLLNYGNPADVWLPLVQDQTPKKGKSKKCLSSLFVHFHLNNFVSLSLVALSAFICAIVNS